MSIFQSIEALAKRLTSQKDSIVDSGKTDINVLDPSLKPVEISAISASEKRSIDDEYFLGLEHKNNGSFLQAIDLFKSVENSSPGYREVYVLLQETYELAAIKEITDKNYIAALLLLKKSQALSSSDQTTARLISHKAFCEHHSGHPQLSIDSYKKAIQICREVVMDCYGTQLIELGWESIVAQEDKKSLRDEAEQYYWKGFKSKSTPEKLGLYKKAIDLCSDYVEAYYSLGCLYITQSDFDNAASTLKEAYRLNPEYENIAYILATLFLNQAKYLEAIQYLEKAVSVRKSADKYAIIYAHLAFCRNQVNDYDGAIKALLDSFRIDPKVAHEKYASSFDESCWDQCIEKSQAFDPEKHRDKNQFIADQHWKHGIRFSNPSYFHKALKFNPESSKAHYSLGCYYYQKGEGQNALNHLKLVDLSQSEFEGAPELIRSIKSRIDIEADLIGEIIEKQYNQASDTPKNSIQSNANLKQIQYHEEVIEKLKADNRSELSKKENIIAELQLKVDQLSQKASDDSVSLNEYEKKMQSSEKLLLSLKTSYFSELSNKDKKIEVSQQKIAQLSNEVESLKATFTNESQHLNAIIDDLKQQLAAVQNMHIESEANDLAGNFGDTLSFEDISIIDKSSVWSEFKLSSSPRALISNYLWDKFRTDLLSTKYGQPVINHLAKQLSLPTLADAEVTVNSCLAHPLYHFLNTTVDSDIDTVILCITALMVLVDAQNANNANKQPVIDLPTVAEPSNDVYSFAIPRPPTNNSILLQPEAPSHLRDIFTSEDDESMVWSDYDDSSRSLEKAKQRTITWADFQFSDVNGITACPQGKSPQWIEPYKQGVAIVHFNKDDCDKCVVQSGCLVERRKESCSISYSGNRGRSQDSKTAIVAITTHDDAYLSQPKALQAQTEGALDMNQIQMKQIETEKVSLLLRDIFTDENESASAVASVPDNDGSLNLDDIHSAFLCILTTKEVWRRDELEKLASGKRLLLEGVLHTINEEVYEACGEPLFEGEDPIELNREVVQQVLSKSEKYGSNQ